MRLTDRLITEGLGYCCPWFFFKHFRRTALIAARLGVTDRAVRTAKAAAALSECAQCPGCLHARITLAGDIRKIPLRERPAEAGEKEVE